jgi:hypothetical protein
LKQVALMPTTVALVVTRRCICVTFSRPMIASFERIGFRAYRPTGRGPRTTCTTTGPCGVKSTSRSYETPA